MDGNIYSYNLSEFKTSKGSENILVLKNINDNTDERMFGDKLYSKNVVEKLIRRSYKELNEIQQKCYSD